MKKSVDAKTENFNLEWKKGTSWGTKGHEQCEGKPVEMVDCCPLHLLILPLLVHAAAFLHHSHDPRGALPIVSAPPSMTQTQTPYARDLIATRLTANLQEHSNVQKFQSSNYLGGQFY
ncbi:hypothetical protein GOP47_0014279 [Adiantum capillus-veneris]|uniref:Uncharacterized protein n=1 Tax=Adiantum capillus-veneris TaxID=13818 RepID=A0A9D4ULA4_ADICA|nr:hypothetical protein GOP47_0014279 [Adiantum capillus-veneris]